ncbi:MAG: LPS-assembly protein LptD [Prevotellaceae bacterium]|nr:LPS-assembly protein LptD [Prevotellaceae bacterium]MDR0560864.1 LPS-assembly protein LptD [Prevotellaceae bacterium]
MKKCSLIIVALIITAGAGVQKMDAQRIIMPDKNEKKTDTVRMAMDSTEAASKSSTFKDPVKYSAKDSIVYDFSDVDTIIFMYTEAKVVSLDMSMSARYIEGSKKTSNIKGLGYVDSTGTQLEKPVFTQGKDSYEMDSIIYNFKSEKARIVNIKTKQGDMQLSGGITKRMPDNSSFIKDVISTTCEDPHPHYYIKITRGKIAGKYTYFGPSYLVIADVPIPLVIPFGFFPQQSSRSSGFRMPTYGEEVARGFFLRNIGYYFALGDYMDLEFQGDYYTLGSWALRSSARYTKKYKFDGTFNLSYAFNATGEKNSSDYRAATTFSVQWSHRQSPKAHPGTGFSANVNFSSANNNLYNNNASHDPYQNINNTISSSISYSRSWDGSPLNLSVNASHSQNMRDSTYSITLPNLTLTMSRLYPFARKERVGSKALYEDISLSYSATFDNKVAFKSTELKNPNFTKKINNGLNHNINIGLPNFTLFKYVNLSPSVRYSTKWYFKSIEKNWDSIRRRVVIDTTSAFSKLGMVHEYGFSASLNTQIYGIVNFKKGSLIEAVRHVVKPSLSLSYNPDMKKAFNGYRRVQVDTLGNTAEYNIYEGQPYGYPSQRESGSISFSLGNNLEMKMRNRKDSTGVKKVPLLNTFDLSTSYNLLADSMNLANISFSGSTNLPGNTALTFRFTLDPYQINERGTRVNKFVWEDKKWLNIGRLTNFSLAFGYSFSGGKGKSDKGKGKSNERDNRDGDDHSSANSRRNTYSPFVYEPFSVPWSFSFNYSYNYNKSYSYSNNQLFTNHAHTQTLGFNASISPTPNWDMRLQSGFDFKAMDLTTTNISIMRKLHCFSFSFNWTPMGRYQSWSFKIGINSSMLADVLKYDKQSSYWDNR